MALPHKLLKQRETYLKDKKIKKDDNDCSVKALAIACNVPYGDAHRTMQMNGRKTNKGAYGYQILRTIRNLGCDYVEVLRWKGKTTKTLDLPREHRYLAITCNHALAVQFGLVKDYSATKNMRIEKVYRIVNPN